MKNQDNEHKNKHSQAYRKAAVVDYYPVDTIYDRRLLYSIVRQVKCERQLIFILSAIAALSPDSPNT